MSKKPGHEQCQFTDAKEKRCRGKAVGGERFCSKHLRFVLTRLHVSQAVIDVFGEQFGVDVDEIKPETDIINELNGDSLDVVEAIMELEDAFDLSFPDDDIETLRTVSDVCNYITDSLLSEARYVTRPAPPAHRLAEEVRVDKGKCQRRITTILGSALFRDHLRQLKLSRATVSPWLRGLLHGKWIEHITTVPVVDAKGSLTTVHVIFLTRQAVSHLKLKVGKMQFREVPLRYIDIEPEYIFDVEGNTVRINVEVRVYQQGEFKSPKLKFEGSLVGPTQEFIERYLELRANIL